MQPIIPVYKRMIQWHDALVTLAKNGLSSTEDMNSFWGDEHEAVLRDLIAGRFHEVIDYIRVMYSLPKESGVLYTDLFQPIMYKIGEHWEKGRITVAHEHLASSVLSRVLAAIHHVPTPLEKKRKTAVVSAGVNEFHQIGARMVADLLELDGWNVQFYGADLPNEMLMSAIEEHNPVFIALSVTMMFNVDQVVKAVTHIQERFGEEAPFIMVGGRIINEHPELKDVIGADAYPVTAVESVDVAAGWRREKR